MPRTNTSGRVRIFGKVAGGPRVVASLQQKKQKISNFLRILPQCVDALTPAQPVLPCAKRGAAGRAALLGVVVGENHSFLRDPVDVRRAGSGTSAPRVSRSAPEPFADPHAFPPGSGGLFIRQREAWLSVFVAFATFCSNLPSVFHQC